jgi:hypothetical protein
MEDMLRQRLARRAFVHYLRTGQQLPEETFLDDVERKFNPYHDPRNGRFTFAPGGPRSSSSGSVAHHRLPQRTAAAKPVRRLLPASASSSQGETMSGISLSRTHREFLSYGERFPPKPGTKDRWIASGEGAMTKARFKDQFISGYRDAIRAAALKYDIPPQLLASIAYDELGNDDVSNDLAYAARAESGRNIPETLGVTEEGRRKIRELNKPRDETSFGPYNIQQRRAAKILGYGDINSMSETARRTLVPTTRDPVAATFMAAKHLSDLRDKDFPDVAGKELTRDQLITIATRFNRGPDISYSEIQENKKNGLKYLRNWRHVSMLIKN